MIFCIVKWQNLYLSGVLIPFYFSSLEKMQLEREKMEAERVRILLQQEASLASQKREREMRWSVLKFKIYLRSEFIDNNWIYDSSAGWPANICWLLFEKFQIPGIINCHNFIIKTDRVYIPCFCTIAQPKYIFFVPFPNSNIFFLYHFPTQIFFLYHFPTQIFFCTISQPKYFFVPFPNPNIFFVPFPNPNIFCTIFQYQID